MPVTHGELTVQQIADIQKNLLVSLRSEDTFWDKFCGHDTVAKGMSSLEWRKLNVKALGLADIKNLAEGVTPDGLTLEYLKFRVGLVNFGTYIAYTDESARFNYDDVVADAKLVLAQHAKEQLEIRKSQAFADTACTMTVGTAANIIKDLRKARTILIKNKVKPLNAGRYAFICTPEQASDILEAVADKITHTSQKEAVIKGYVGELAGFVIYENADPIMYSEEGKGLCFFIGKTEDGMPVKTV
jgi:N4-gp56 family major capsid protein